jgi:serine/threonine-protein kinase RsbW
MRKKRELRLLSVMDSIRTVEEFSERISDEYFLNDSYFGNISTCLAEAVKNAIIHGNGEDETKTVFVLMEEKDEGLLFTVIDQGQGYDHKKYTAKIPESGSGKGLFLIYSLADEVNIQNRGRVISMLFRINGIDQKIAESRTQALLEYQKAAAKLAGTHPE